MERESFGRGETKERAMTKERSVKRRVRQRMTKTGETYTVARSYVVGKRDRVREARGRLTAMDDRPTAPPCGTEMGPTGAVSKWRDGLFRWTIIR